MSIEFSFHGLKAAERLPSPSGTALAIMQLVQKDNATMQKLAELVKVDPALTARILSIANSVAFGAQRPIATVNDAVVDRDAIGTQFCLEPVFSRQQSQWSLPWL